jgi:phosphate/phosphite/phosphonate ABC transporter binding protein
MGTRSLRFATYLAPNVIPLYRLIARRVGLALGRPAELVTGSDHAALAHGDEDVAFLCSPPYVALVDRDEPAVELLAAPVLVGERYGDRPVYFSEVIVHRDSPIARFEDLRGCSWAFNEPDSHSGYGATRAKLAEMGEVNGFFGRVVRVGFHQRAIRLVARGEVDASAIDSQVLEIELRDRSELAEQLRVIDSLGPSTIQPVVASRRLPVDVRARIRGVLLELHDDADARRKMAACSVKRFDPVSDGDYDDIRAMMALADSAGLEGFGPPTG